jgi:hypothetical protein
MPFHPPRTAQEAQLGGQLPIIGPIKLICLFFIDEEKILRFSDSQKKLSFSYVQWVIKCAT